MINAPDAAFDQSGVEGCFRWVAPWTTPVGGLSQ
jgi:hypothetical protein